MDARYLRMAGQSKDHGGQQSASVANGVAGADRVQNLGLSSPSNTRGLRSTMRPGLGPRPDLSEPGRSVLLPQQQKPCLTSPSERGNEDCWSSETVEVQNMPLPTQTTGHVCLKTHAWNYVSRLRALLAMQALSPIEAHVKVSLHLRLLTIIHSRANGSLSQSLLQACLEGAVHCFTRVVHSSLEFTSTRQVYSPESTETPQCCSKVANPASALC